MKNLFLILISFFFAFQNNSYAGLGRDSLGAGGYKRDIEVNEIDEIEADALEEDFKQKSIESIELQNVDKDSIGTLYEGEGGLKYEMWEGTNRSFVEEYLKILPVNTKSDIAIKLAKELLLTTANVPMGEGKEDLILLRINKLIELGDLNNAHLLIQSLSSDQKKEEILKRELEINLSLNNFDLVCSDIEDILKKFKTDLYWKKIQIFCQILNEEIDKANLFISLIKENDNFDDKEFLNIIENLIYGEEIDSQVLTNLNLLNLAMTRIGKINLSEDLSFREEPLFYSMLYRMPNVPIKVRLQALEKSQKLINIPLDVVEEIYNSYEPTEEEMNIPLDDDFLYLGPAIQAILYQRAIKETDSQIKGKILKKSIDLSLINGNYSLISQINLETILEIKPSKDLAWFAGTATKTLFYLKKIDEALEWYKILSKSRNNSSELFLEFVEIWPMVQIFKRYNPELEESIRDISQDEIVASLNTITLKEEDFSMNTIGYYLLETYGVEINPKFWLVNLNNNSNKKLSMPNESLLSLLNHSAKTNKQGETAMLILISIGDSNLSDISPFFLQMAIKSLDRIGLDEKARDLALESLIN